MHIACGYGLFTGGLGAHYGAEKLGCTVVPVSGGMTERQVTLIEDFKPRIIMVTPSCMITLLDEFRARGVDPAQISLAVGIFGAEPWTNAMRGAIERAFDMHAVDIYGLSEVMGPGVAVNRLCGSGLDAVGMAARGVRSRDCDLVIAGGVESMSRAPFVMPKAETHFARATALYDTTIGWRFVNPALKQAYGTESMPGTADDVAADYDVSRADQDAFAIRSQQRWDGARQRGRFDAEIAPITIRQRRGDPIVVARDEHPRPDAQLARPAALKGINGPDLSVIAGNASGVNDGACALILASEKAAARHGLRPMARVVAMAAAGVSPRVMVVGPAPATRTALARAKLSLFQMDVIELSEAFAAQAPAMRSASARA